MIARKPIRLGSLTLEAMQEEHIPAILEIERRCYSAPWSEEAFLSELRNRAAVYLVAQLEGQLVGFGGMWLVVEEAHITTLAVDPPFRGLGIGERLLNALLSIAVERGMERATLEVRVGNLVAQNLYRKYGFQAVAVRKQYYANNKEDALVMWLEGLQSEAFRERLQALQEQWHNAGLGDRNQL